MHCHDSLDNLTISSGGSIALVGHPNVGKSAIFQRLTGQHVAISNYPGTTVEVTRGQARDLPQTILVDTPGVIAFPPHSEDEIVTARVLYHEDLKAILQVGDAKNLRRTVLLSVQLAEMGLPMVLALNMMDEADNRGVRINIKLLADKLSLPVIPTAAVRARGLKELVHSLGSAQTSRFRLAYPPEVEAALADLCTHLRIVPFAGRAIALLWLSGDEVTGNWLRENLGVDTYQYFVDRRDQLQLACIERLGVLIQKVRLEFVEEIADSVLLATGSNWGARSSRLRHWTTQPFSGTLILALVLYALYWFVGVFGAGTLVDWLESQLFGEIINPWVIETVTRWVPFPLLADFLVGEYGLWTMGMTYALALILPIVSTFFLAFGIMEDSGYLPRLAALSNRLFRALGLNGKAVLPMVLGLGCVTMATLTTRVLENKRERLLVTLLLALAVPCSAQLGVVMGMLAGISLGATIIWGGVVFLVLLAVGWLAARLVPGKRTPLLVELPPMRWPVFSNVILKTLARLEWYLKEVVPLFLFGTALMFFMDATGILDWLIQISKPLVNGWLGLPPQASAAFLMGFLRRDFGATGLFVMEAQGLLTPLQVVVAMVTVTLFIPCIASVMVIGKERGWRTAAGIMVLVFPLAFLVGGLLNQILLATGWGA
jgi:ferrous iron transport protein B